MENAAFERIVKEHKEGCAREDRQWKLVRRFEGFFLFSMMAHAGSLFLSVLASAGYGVRWAIIATIFGLFALLSALVRRHYRRAALDGQKKNGEMRDETLRMARQEDRRERQEYLNQFPAGPVTFDQATVSFVLPKGRKLVSFDGKHRKFVLRTMRPNETPEEYEMHGDFNLGEAGMITRIREQA